MRPLSCEPEVPVRGSPVRSVARRGYSVVLHVLLIKDDFPDAQIFIEAILDLHSDDDGKEALTELGMPEGFEAMSEEDAEFMIDLMQTLLD